MAGGTTNQTNKTSGFLNPSNKFSYCDLPPLDPYRTRHSMTGLMACGGIEDGVGTSCSTFNTVRGVWEESYQFSTRRYEHVAWNTSEGVLLMGGGDYSSYMTTTLLLPGGGSRPGFLLKTSCYSCCAAVDPYTNTIILSSGSSVERYGMRGYLETLPSPSYSRSNHACAIYYTDYKMPV